MDTVLVRFGEIGSKGGSVRGHMLNVLRQRVEDRLEYEDLEYENISRTPGRIIVKTGEAQKVVRHVHELPGVASASPAYGTEPEIESLKEKSDRLEMGDTFGVETNRSGEHEFDSREVNRELGDHVRKSTGSEVDLDNPETWVRVDVRKDRAFIFTEVLEGPGGFPTGVQGELAALISGGIDSPVSAYKVMTRGTDIMPVYFYNKPVAAEDHLLRFKSVVDKLERFNPSKKWEYYVVDMEEVNERLMEVGKGRMVVHRRLMFKVAEKIAEKEGLKGLVTGESMGQKSSQTPQNLEMTTRAVDKPVFRPLLTYNKKDISQKAREIGTMEDAKIESACTSLAPESPATELKRKKLEKIEEEVDLDELVDLAMENTEKNVL